MGGGADPHDASCPAFPRSDVGKVGAKVHTAAHLDGLFKGEVVEHFPNVNICHPSSWFHRSQQECESREHEWRGPERLVQIRLGAEDDPYISIALGHGEVRRET